MKVTNADQLQVGMVVKQDVVGKKGDVKINKGEVITQLHIDKLKKWSKGKDAKGNTGDIFAYNRGAIEIGSDPRQTGGLYPKVEKEPWRSPVIESGAKNKNQSSMRVPCDIDDNGNIVRDDEEVIQPEAVDPVDHTAEVETKGGEADDATVPESDGEGEPKEPAKPKTKKRGSRKKGR